VKETLDWIARHLVDDPDSVEIEEVVGDRSTTYRLHVAEDDMGKVIGRGGRTARAIRTVMKAAGHQTGVNPFVEIVD
jgi:predicted RNA-binding protein YlqC (UPF0109 family)